MALWTAFLLLALSTISWAGIVLVAPYYFLVPGIALLILIGFVTIVAGSQNKQFIHLDVGETIPAVERNTTPG
jgi:hypothetical protein